MADLMSWVARKFEREFRAEIEAENVSHRESLAADLAAANKKASVAVPKAAKDRDAAEKAMHAARRAASEAEAAWHRSLAASMGASTQHDGIIASIERKLRETSPPEIDEAIGELGRELEKLRRDGAETTEGWTGRQTWAGIPEVEIDSDGPSRAARRDAIRAAIDELDALKLDAKADVPKSIERIRDSLPELKVTRIYAGPRNSIFAPTPAGIL